MSKTETTKWKEDGHWHESVKTNYDSGESKTVTSDITDRNLLGGDEVESVTHTDSHGNSRTEK